MRKPQVVSIQDKPEGNETTDCGAFNAGLDASKDLAIRELEQRIADLEREKNDILIKLHEYEVICTKRVTLPSKPQEPMLRDIMLAVAEKHKLSTEVLQSECRIRKVVAARQEFFYLARLKTTKRIPQIGRYCGGRDHSTVIHGIRKHCARNRIPPLNN